MHLSNKHKPQVFESLSHPPSLPPSKFVSIREIAKWISSNFVLKVKFTSRLTSIENFSPMGEFFFVEAAIA